MDDDETFERKRAAEAAMTTLPGECALCYVDRMLTAFGCDATLRWAGRWRDRRAPRAMRLENLLRARGGSCDCEVFRNGWQPARELRGDPRAGLRPPRCAGARVATEPCDNWVGRPPPGW